MNENLFTQMQQNVALCQKAWSDHLARVTAIYEEVGKAETQGLHHVSAAIDEGTRVARETLAYTTLLSAEWRKLQLEAAKRTAQCFGMISE